MRAERGIIDGDTFRVKGLKQSLRLLAIDTEEQPRTDYPSEELTRLMRSDFAAYSQRMAQGRALPAKYPTPMGERATEFARSRIPPGSKLRLSIIREGVDKPLDFEVERAIITIASVKQRMLEPGFGYIRIAHFKTRTSGDLLGAISKLKKGDRLTVKILRNERAETLSLIL